MTRALEASLSLKRYLSLFPAPTTRTSAIPRGFPTDRSLSETVTRYAVEAAHFLQSQGAQLLVIACNTATALSLDSITAAVKVPVIGVVEPGAEAAASATRNQKIVVIGTEATVSSHAYRKALEARGLQAREKACPLLVPLVEEGWVEHPVTEQVASIYLAEAFADGFHDADALVLGCTHYPLLKPLLQRVTPEHVRIVDSAESTAQDVASRLREIGASYSDSGRRAPENAPAEVFCHRFDGEIPAARTAVSGASDRERAACGLEGIDTRRMRNLRVGGISALSRSASRDGRFGRHRIINS